MSRNSALLCGLNSPLCHFRIPFLSKRHSEDVDMDESPSALPTKYLFVCLFFDFLISSVMHPYSLYLGLTL